MGNNLLKQLTHSLKRECKVNLVNCGNQLPEPNLILYANTNDEVSTYLSHQKYPCIYMYPKAKQDRDEESEVV